MVDDVDELGFINRPTAGACLERLVKLPRKASRTGELEQPTLEVTAMLQQACCLGRRDGVGHGIWEGTGDSIPRRFPRGRRSLPLLRRSDDPGPLPAKPRRQAAPAAGNPQRCSPNIPRAQIATILLSSIATSRAVGTVRPVGAKREVYLHLWVPKTYATRRHP